MIKITKLQLQQVFKTVDNKNSKFELNHIYIDDENIVSTDTRAISIIQHDEKVDIPFLICRSIIDVALKNKNAYFYDIHQKGIDLLDKDDRHIMSIIQPERSDNHFRFPDYKRVIPKKTTKQIEFYQKSQISGLLLANRVFIDEKYVPDVKEGTVGITGSNTPIIINDPITKLTYVAMPICGILDD
ncbi:hypothetical protein [Sulfurimonas sp. HSL-1716]|uniref:hypothetical protein n=1 Tax=Hydrocurvibacter sulfurireducens TaxID=3131937 RepID=UPI0031F79F63